MAKLMIRSNIAVSPVSMAVFGAGFAKFGLQNKTVGGGVTCARLQALDNLDDLAVCPADLHRLRHESTLNRDKDYALAIDVLDGLGLHRNGHLDISTEYVD